MPQLVDPSTGTLHDVADADAAGALAAGWHPETISDADRLSTGAANELNYGGAAGVVKSGLAGLVRGATLGGSDVAARVLGGEDTARTLAGLQAQNPITSGVSEFAGALAPAVLSGGTATPAGVAASIGRKVTAGAAREGAGLIERTAAHAVGAAAEGSLYGGGAYLSQTALENKPLSAEGFVGAMGKGALFAAPIGGGFSLAGEGLMRARALFPRSQITAEAGAVAKSEASDAIHQSISDADAMAATARQKIAIADAQAGAAGARTQVTRTVFGGGDPAAMGAEVDAAANKTQLTEALQKLETSQTALKDWIAAGGDAELEAGLAALRAPDVQAGGAGVPVGEFGAPGARGFKSQDELARLASGTGAPGAVLPPDLAPQATRQLRMAKGTTPGSPEAVLDQLQPTPAIEAPPAVGPASLEDIRAPGEQPGTAVGRRPRATAGDDLLATLGATKREGEGGLAIPEVHPDSEGFTPLRGNGQFHAMGDDEFEAFQKNYKQGLSADERSDAQLYAGGGRFRELNGGARQGVVHATNAEAADKLDALIEKSPLDRPVQVARVVGMEDSSGAARKLWSGLRPGDVVTDGGWQSTTANFEYAKTLGDVMMIVDVPRGYPAAPMPGPHNEWELVLRRDTSYRVKSIREVDGKLFAHVEVVPAAAPPSPLSVLARGESAPKGEAVRIARAAGSSEAGGIPGYDAVKSHEAKADAALEKTVSARAIADRGYYEPPIKPDRPELTLEAADPVRMAKARAEIAEGQREAVDLNVTPSGKITVTGGRHRLAAAIEADAPIKVKWSTAAEPAESDVLRAGPSRGGAGADDLLAQLQGTASKLDEGAKLSDIGAGPRAEYAGAKAERSAEAARHFRAQALEAQDIAQPWNAGIAHGKGGTYDTSAMGAAEREAQGLASKAQLTSVLEPGAVPRFDPKTRTYHNAGGPAVEAGPHAPSEPATGIMKRPALAADAALTDLVGPARKGGPAELANMLGIDTSTMPVSAAEYSARREAMGFGSALDKRAIGRAAENDAIERLLQKHNGKNVDIAPALERAAQVIGDHEAASAEVAGLLGADAPKTAVQRAEALAAARQAHAEASGASAAKAAHGLQDRGMGALGDRTVVEPGIRAEMDALRGRGDKTVVDPTIAEAVRAAAPGKATTPAGKTGLGGKLADIGTALEVMKALGVHVPALSAIPIIGPVLGLFLKARAVLGILGRKGGSIGRDVDGLIAARAAATRERLATATEAILTGAGKGALKLSEAIDGPAVTLGYKLFPGDGITKAKDPQRLYEARMDEIARAQQPGAIDHAIGDRYQTSDPNLHDALVGQVQRGIAFLDSKAPKPSILQTMLPGDGVWKPSRAQLDEWGKYVHAVGDPASVLEDLAKGHVSMEGAETLRVVYPELFAEAQQLLLQAAPRLQKTLPYPTRVAISIIYRVPVDASMAPGHLQYLQSAQGPQAGPGPSGGPPGAPPAPPQPAITGPLQLGQSTMTSLDRRAGA